MRSNLPFRAILRPVSQGMRRIAQGWREARARRRVARFTRPFKLHAGCGGIHWDGWINVDCANHVGQVDLCWDLSRGIPVPDASCEMIYSEHMLEHLSVEQGLQFLRECRRALVRGGVARIAMPSLDDLLEKSASGRWRDQAWLRQPPWQFIATRAEMLNIAFRWWGHQWLYDREELHRRLREAGFATIRDVEWGRSELSGLCNLETRDDSLLICEAVKTDA